MEGSSVVNRILVITSCTGEKVVSHERALMLADFRRGGEHVSAREAELIDLLRPAEEIYTGQQHVRLMRGVRRIREAANWTVDLHIVSAGYGLIPGDRRIAPYEMTFAGMKKKELRAWAEELGVPAAFRALLSAKWDLALVLLGDDYLEACGPDAEMSLGGPTLLLCGHRTAAKVPALERLRVVPVGNKEAKRFSCGLVALKGELGQRVLGRLVDGEPLSGLLSRNVDVLALLDTAEPKRATRQAARANPAVDYVIQIPKSWWDKPHRAKLRYFIPEWDDLVDPAYDYATDTHSGGSGDWSNEVYAHQLYPEPNYDGILVSKVVAEKSKKKKERINALGVHRFLRVPREFPIMGDCGAFGYINEDVPPYSTGEILDYYTRLGFDYGVSVDHLIVTATEDQKQERYELTIQNAEDFLVEHRKRGLPWEPVGAVQGWDPPSYAKAARKYVAMGYRYIGLGGLVRSSTRDVLAVLKEVHRAVPYGVAIHLFGLARTHALRDFAALGVRSVDSASFLRRAWMASGGENYLAEDGFYTAIRIPEVGKSFRAKRMVSEGRAGGDQSAAFEQAALAAVRGYDAGMVSLSSTLDAVLAFDRLITPERVDHTDRIQRTLEAMPWRRCQCEICRRDGVEVIIFRGNNRNRRRGFHNTYAFYRLLQRMLAGEIVKVGVNPETQFPDQLQFLGVATS
jgi:uncharacterized protein DUF6884/queuine tRNA-ribosyltransferase-like protein